MGSHTTAFVQFPFPLGFSSNHRQSCVGPSWAWLPRHSRPAGIRGRVGSTWGPAHPSPGTPPEHRPLQIQDACLKSLGVEGTSFSLGYSDGLFLSRLLLSPASHPILRRSCHCSSLGRSITQLAMAQQLISLSPAPTPPGKRRQTPEKQGSSGSSVFACPLLGVGGE